MAKFSPNMRGILALVCAMAFFVGNDSAMKLVGTSLPLTQTIFVRGLLASCFCLAAILLRGESASLRQITRPLVLVRASTEIIGSFTFLAALQMMPISDVTAIEQIVPLLLTAFAALVLGERIAVSRIFAICIGFAGALLIAAPTGQVSTGAWLAFATAMAVTARDLIGRRLGHSVSPLVTTLAGTLTVGLAALASSFVPAFGQHWFDLSLAQLGLLVLASILLSCAYVGMIVAMRQGQVQALAPFYYSQTIFALLASQFVFGDVLTLQAMLGTALVVAAGLFVIMPWPRQFAAAKIPVDLSLVPHE